MNDKFLIPDITFILKVGAEVCVSRIEERGTDKTLFERTEKLRSVWQAYVILPNHIKNAYIINGEKSIEEVFEQVKTFVHSKLNL